ncbi:MAG: hypothetical protein HY420_03130 [Candidatus Kerfeldbacteria bacterium]|nr:hypothetical protein [Candidatus Kerfeldbacteria bacterium]
MQKRLKQNWWPALIVLSILVIAALGRDAWSLARHTYDFDRHIPFLLPVSLGAFGLIVWCIKRFDETGC